MKKRLHVILLLSANYVFAQDPTHITQPAEPCDNVFTIVEEMPLFPGGNDSLFKFIADNLKYPKHVKELSGNKRVYVTFVVKKDGRISEPKVIRGLTKELDEEALRVAKLIPRWIPGKQNGEPACVQFNLPINFYLE